MILQRQPISHDTLPAAAASQPLSSQRAAFDSNAYAPASTSMPAEYLKLLQRHRTKILLVACAGLLLGALVSLFTPPMYRTRASLNIEGLNGEFTEARKLSQPGGDADTPEVLQQTQIKLLQSDTVLQKTVQALLSDPHPSVIAQKGFLARTAATLHLPVLRTMPFARVVQETAGSVKVKPFGMTRLVELSCESRDPEIAANFCNRLVSVYEEHDMQNRLDEAQKTSRWLIKQLGDVKQQAEESQRKLKDAVGGNGLVLSPDASSTGEARLRELQQELVKAQSERMQKEAETRIATLATGNALPSVMDNPAYRQYESRLEDLHNKLAEMVPPLTEENPKVIHVRAQIREAEQGMQVTRNLSTGRESNELDALRHRESLLDAAYRQQESKVSVDLQSAAQVSLLRREVESEQQLYQTMLQRVKEAGLAAAMQVSTIRIVDPAKIPSVPSTPRKVVDAGAGLMLGGLFGMGFFMYRDRTVRVLRMPGEIQQVLGVEELGTIPRAEGRRNLAKNVSQERLSLNAPSEAGVQLGEALTETHWESRSSIVAEAYRSATFSILLASQRSGTSRTYIVSSPNDGEGKTTVTSNLGVALSKSRLRVLLIDGDMRKPRLHAAFGVELKEGLRELLRGDINAGTAELRSFCTQTAMPNLSIITAGLGTEDTVELLHSRELSGLLNRVSSSFDVVLVDTPPVLHMADARILGNLSHGGIVVFRAATTTVKQAQSAIDIFERDGVPVIGTILNDFIPAREGLSSYYSSYQRYQQDDAGHTEAA